MRLLRRAESKNNKDHLSGQARFGKLTDIVVARHRLDSVHSSNHVKQKAEYHLEARRLVALF